MRALALSLTVFVGGCAGCTTPMLPPLSGIRTCGAGSRTPILADLSAADLLALEAGAMRGIVAVAYDGCTLRVLSECAVEGSYGLEEREAMETVLTFSEPPAPGGGILGAFVIDDAIRPGRVVDLHYAIRATRAADLDAIDPREVLRTRGCENATHLVRAIDLGALVVASRADTEPAAPTLGAAAAGAAGTSTLVSRGAPECAAPGEPCNAPVRLVLGSLRGTEVLGAGPGPGPGASNFGTLTIRSEADATTAEGASGGNVDARTLGPECMGFIDERPDHLLVLESRFDRLVVEAQSSADVTLVVETPDGHFLCNDDAAPNQTDPRLTAALGAGTYRVWVGSYEAGASAPYRLSVSTSGAVATGCGAAGPCADGFECVGRRCIPEQAAAGCLTSEECPVGSECHARRCVVQDTSELASWRVGTGEPDLGRGVVRLEPRCSPGSPEEPNAIDDDCDGRADEGTGPVGSIEVAISWETRADVDLRIIDPRGNEVSPDSPEAPTGGRLERAAQSACVGGEPERRERIVWTPPTPPFGSWAVELHVRAACGHAAPTRVVFSIAAGGRLLGEYRVDLLPGGDAVRVATFGVP